MSTQKTNSQSQCGTSNFNFSWGSGGDPQSMEADWRPPTKIAEAEAALKKKVKVKVKSHEKANAQGQGQIVQSDWNLLKPKAEIEEDE